MARLDPHSYTDLEQGRISAAQIQLRVDFSRRQLWARVDLSVSGAHGGRLDLDTRDLTIAKVEDAKGATLAWHLADRDPILGSCLSVDLPSGTPFLRITYSTSPQASALQWLEPQHTAGGRHPYLFSQCQPHHARSLLPIQDSPAVRFTFGAQVQVPEPLVAVMAAAPGERLPSSEAGQREYRFAMPQPIPAYLFALAVGNLASEDLGPRTRVYAEPETVAKAAWEFAAADAMLQSAERLFGPYQWDRYDFLVMPPAFPYGGMENPRLTFLTPTLLAGDRSLVNVLAHELAHSWTGNLVTNATMNDFWLNEGFTVWAERRILESLEGREAMVLAATIGAHSLRADLERFGADSPYTRLKTNLTGIDPDDVYSQIPYEKGFLLVVLLEQTVGRGRFDAFVRAYMHRFRFTSINTEEFLSFLEQEMPGVAAQVQAETWIYEPGIPANAPVFASPQIQALKQLAANWPNGQRPDPEEVRKWTIPQWLVYLGELPKQMTVADCAWLDRTFRLNESGNAEILSLWLALAAASAYEPAWARIRSFLGSVGRMKFLKPIYRALAASDRTQPLAQEIFAQTAGRYHPIARSGIEALLKDAAARAKAT